MIASNRFTINDIHNIRYENYEKTKDLSPKELIEKTKKEAANGWEIIARLRSGNPQ